ncbi:hypothetical protein DE146DRAFT_110733 [Phaeosphaeria sp. MPI-PUGE-AT-0046c]|nr:hypothetical protein DE146DRAFT_110733 [Phaeosphaeria sp. MPI-PUGE-AT-0046c]
MTPRSTKQHHKSTTISRRIRSRAQQNLSVQPPETVQLRSVRPRRAATLPEPHLDTLQVRHQFLQQQLGGSISGNPNSSETSRRLQGFAHSPQNSPQGPSPGPTATEYPTTQNFQLSPLTAFEPSPSPLPSVSDSLDFGVSLSSADPQHPHNTLVDFQDMSTLGFMMAPTQYGMNHYGSSPSYPQYPSTSQHGYTEHRSSTAGPYESSYASSPALAHEQRRLEDPSILPPYQAQPQQLSRSPYQQQAPTSMRSTSIPLAPTVQGFSYSTPHSSIPTQPLGSNASTYPPPQLYPPTTYGVSDYHPLPTMYPPSSTTPAAYPSYASSSGISQQPSGDVPPLSPSPGAQGNPVMPRILNSRPKPQCWEHGCNGRQFSTFSNLLRHQREKSGTASKSYCPRCGAEFTRTTARNGHMAHDKCKPRRPSDASH